jgi:hypothetical protein
MVLQNYIELGIAIQKVVDAAEQQAATYMVVQGATVHTTHPPPAASAAATGAPPVFATLGAFCRMTLSSKVQKSRVPVAL